MACVQMAALPVAEQGLESKPAEVKFGQQWRNLSSFGGCTELVAPPIQLPLQYALHWPKFAHKQLLWRQDSKRLHIIYTYIINYRNLLIDKDFFHDDIIHMYTLCVFLCTHRWRLTVPSDKERKLRIATHLCIWAKHGRYQESQPARRPLWNFESECCLKPGGRLGVGWEEEASNLSSYYDWMLKGLGLMM